MIPEFFYEVLRLTNTRAWRIDKLCERVGVSDAQMRSAIEVGEKAGYHVRLKDNFISSKAPAVRALNEITIGKKSPGRYHVAILTDTHFGSKHCDREGVVRFLNLAHERGCKAVVVTGDILDGFKEVLIHDQDFVGRDRQCADAISTLKKAPKGLKFVAIDGNHDGYFSHSVGFTSGAQLEKEMREEGIDWSFAGVCLGTAQIYGAKWQMWHPHGGSSTRNAIRRILNARMESFEEKIDILAMGHFHKFSTVYAYPENVFGVSGGTFQTKRSEFANRISQNWDVGGVIVSYTITKEGTTTEISAAFYPAA